jgi:hypothetical protein
MAEVQKNKTITIELTEEEAQVIAALCGLTNGCDSSALAARSVFDALTDAGIKWRSVYATIKMNRLMNSIQFAE